MHVTARLTSPGNISYDFLPSRVLTFAFSKYGCTCRPNRGPFHRKRPEPPRRRSRRSNRDLQRHTGHTARIPCVSTEEVWMQVLTVYRASWWCIKLALTCAKRRTFPRPMDGRTNGMHSQAACLGNSERGQLSHAHRQRSVVPRIVDILGDIATV